MPRASVLLRVDYESATALGLAHSTNLSSGGLFLRTDAALPVGTILKLVIAFPEVVPPMAVDAEVRSTGTELGNASAGVGLAFRSVSPENQARLAAMVASLDTSGGPAKVKASPPVPPDGTKGVRVTLLASSSVLANIFRNRINRIGRQAGWEVDLALVGSLDLLRPSLVERRARLFIIDQDSIESLSEVVKAIRSERRHVRTPLVVLGSATRAVGLEAQEMLYFRKPIAMKPLLGIIGLVSGVRTAGAP